MSNRIYFSTVNINKHKAVFLLDYFHFIDITVPISLSPSALHDFSAIYHPIVLKFGQMIDTDLCKSCLHLGANVKGQGHKDKKI